MIHVCQHCKTVQSQSHVFCESCGERILHECTAWAVMSPKQRSLHSPDEDPYKPNFIVENEKYCPVCSSPTTLVEEVREWIPFSQYFEIEQLSKDHLKKYGFPLYCFDDVV